MSAILKERYVSLFTNSFLLWNYDSQDHKDKVSGHGQSKIWIVLWMIIRIAALAYFLTCIFLFENKNGYDKLFMIRIIFVMLSSSSPSVIVIHNLAMKKVKDAVNNPDYKVSWLEILGFMIVTIPFNIGWPLLIVPVIQGIMDSGNANNSLLILAIIIACIASWYEYKVALLGLFKCLNGFRDKCMKLYNRKSISLKQAEEMFVSYKTFQDGIRLLVLYYFSSCTICVILSSFLFIKGTDAYALGAVCVASCVTIVVFTFVYAVEKIYELLEQIGDKLEIFAMQQKNIGLMYRYMSQARQFRDHSKFNGCGFFEVDSTTITSIAGLTATYIIILMQ